MKQKRERGKPSYIKDRDDLESKINEYFKEKVHQERFPTISGLAHHLGYASRQSLYDLQNQKEYSYIVKKAVLYIESLHEEQLASRNVAGHIFWLKNRGWTDSKTVDIKQEKPSKADILKEIDEIDKILNERDEQQ